MVCLECGASSEKLVKSRKCRSCYNQYMRDYMDRRYHKRRKSLVDLLGGSCIDCRSDEELQFDHADASSKSFNVAKRLASAPWETILEEIDKCVLRCKSCHDHKTSVMGDDRSVDHGEGLTGKKNCYCESCAPLKRAYNNQWREDRKH